MSDVLDWIQSIVVQQVHDLIQGESICISLKECIADLENTAMHLPPSVDINHVVPPLF
jgi:hypothetical protein